MHVEKLEELFSGSPLQLWQTGGDTLRADAPMEGYDVIQLMHMHSVHPHHYKETMSMILFDICCMHTPVYPKITCDKFYDCTFFLHSIQLHKHFQTPEEHTLYMDTNVALWLNSHAYKKLPCLRLCDCNRNSAHRV